MVGLAIIMMNANVYATEITPIEGTDDFTLYGGWVEEYSMNIAAQDVQGNLYYGTYNGWVGVYSYNDEAVNRVYYAVMSQISMQPGEYVFDHRFFNKEATIITDVNNDNVKSVVYTPKPTIGQVTELYSQSINGGFELTQDSVGVNLGFSIEHGTSYTSDEITVTVRSLNKNLNKKHLETKFSFSNYTSKTAANRSLMVFNQIHIYYIDKTAHPSLTTFKFSGSIKAEFYRVGFWNSAKMEHKTNWESNNIQG